MFDDTVREVFQEAERRRKERERLLTALLFLACVILAAVWRAL